MPGMGAWTGCGCTAPYCGAELELWAFTFCHPFFTCSHWPLFTEGRRAVVGKPLVEYLFYCKSSQQVPWEVRVLAHEELIGIHASVLLDDSGVYIRPGFCSDSSFRLCSSFQHSLGSQNDICCSSYAFSRRNVWGDGIATSRRGD
jgi:hypothetical protein